MRFFDSELEGTATYWRVRRRDGVALGFTTHDRDLWFGGMRHRAAPGMTPAAIRRSSDLSPDSAEVEGALAHDAITEADLAGGRYDEATVEVGVVDWETLEHAPLYHGTIGSTGMDGSAFFAELHSAKQALAIDPVPRTSPTCRALFCGPGCTLSAPRFTHEATLASIDLDANRVQFAGNVTPELFREGWVRWIDGPQAGLRMAVVRAEVGGLVLADALDPEAMPGMRAELREGCDHTLATCGTRFANAVNFQGEPFLPGNDILTRYPTPPS